MGGSAERMRKMRTERKDRNWAPVSTDVPTRDGARFMYEIAKRLRAGQAPAQIIVAMQDAAVAAGLDTSMVESHKAALDATRGQLLDRFARILAMAGEDRLGRVGTRLETLESWLGIKA